MGWLPVSQLRNLKLRPRTPTLTHAESKGECLSLQRSENAKIYSRLYLKKKKKCRRSTSVLFLPLLYQTSQCSGGRFSLARCPRAAQVLPVDGSPAAPAAPFHRAPVPHGRAAHPLGPGDPAERNRPRPRCQITSNTLRKPLHLATGLRSGCCTYRCLRYRAAGEREEEKKKKKKAQRCTYTQLKSQKAQLQSTPAYLSRKTTFSLFNKINTLLL